MKNQPNSSEIDHWIKLLRAEGVGSVTLAKLLAEFGSPQIALGASAAQMTKISGIGPRTAEAIARTRNSFNVEAELELAERLGVWVINLQDSRYPVLLKGIYDPPPVLYIKGTLEKADNLAIAIVGARRCSIYGAEQAGRFAHLLASSGVTIVSGMARGIDTAAHTGALTAGARTIAVQGCGLANIFPPENKKLFEKIANSGACVSELPLTYEPLSENFPARNRIIAGLSLASLVIEAAPRSGALLTAAAALDNNREVMAVPGKIDSPLSKGTNRLIKDGARLVDSVKDIIESLGQIGQGISEHVSISATKAVKEMEMPLFSTEQLTLSDNDRAVINCLGKEPMHIEDIIAQVEIAPGSINASLTSLRLKGLIKQFQGNSFSTTG
ncbi:MAG: DNA-protecting protein DprA [Planctomycetes bacterium]|nr:DNA-protecting protein DprA [Planctomycetota bacterium]